MRKVLLRITYYSFRRKKIKAFKNPYQLDYFTKPFCAIIASTTKR